MLGAWDTDPGLSLLVPQPLLNSSDTCVSSCSSWVLGLTFSPRQPALLSPTPFEVPVPLMGTLFTPHSPNSLLHILQSPTRALALKNFRPSSDLGAPPSAYQNPLCSPAHTRSPVLCHPGTCTCHPTQELLEGGTASC